MASSYALPASAIHNHHGHIHSHSHSLAPSPSRAYPSNSPRPLRSERSNGTLHTHSSSESSIGHTQEQTSSNFNNATYNPNHDRLSPLSHARNSNGYASQSGSSEKNKLEYTHPLSQVRSYDAPMNDVDVIPHGHGHDHNHEHENDHHAHDHSHDRHGHGHNIPSEPHSKFTGFVLPWVKRWPLLYTIMAEKDSRRIFYFMSLNFAFMMVQACYGYLTDSLGLLSDSIHMFFDCLALGVGLFAAVASKWPPSERFPYGFGKIESLSGFGNGVFLMLISIEIMIEATERLADGRETKRLAELFVVSAMGLAVNLVGMACFGHHHHGHDHGDHGHGQAHSHSDEKAHSHDDNHDHDHGHHDHSHEHGLEHDNCNHNQLLSGSQPPKGHDHSHAGHSHGHDHDNENMHGIFLHVLADTMGSAAVMVSTALIYLVGWSGWDPLASCVIAILIFLSSIPLITSTAKKLLLTVPDGVEYNLRATLSGVSDVRGVASYSATRFWMGDKNAEAEPGGILGVVHISCTRGSDLEDVRSRAQTFLKNNGINAVVQVEKDGDTSCWCGGSSSRSPSRF
ncbi:cation efflux family-domain-containing protein [Amylocarpus encephaloides]|uniref:Zinc transporter n=1 Tax=Amylocarpus encephaloides TaxID=45428 RepID=A0A9P8C9L7_9HELO|nr:cation efflux family-domain-containing protein [Amylocarpus encephaloides]